MPGLIESIRDRIAGVSIKDTADKASTAGMLKNRDKYNAYAENMIAQGKQPLTFAQWSRQ